MNLQIEFHRLTLLLMVGFVLGIYSNSRAQLLIPAVSEEGKWGYVSKLERETAFVIPPQFDLAGRFRSKLAPVQDSSGLWGYIDSSGQLRIESQFTIADEFSEEVAAVQKKGFLLYIRPTGETALETNFAWGEKFCENIAVVKPDLRLKRYGAINRDGQIVIKPNYRFLGNCSNGLLPAQREDGSWIFVRSNGEELSATYEFVSGFVDNFASVSINGKFTLLNQNLNPITPPHDFRIFTLKNAILVSADQSAKIPIEKIAANRRLQGIALTSLNQFEPMIVQLDIAGPNQVDEQSGRPRRLSSDPTVDVSLISNPEKADIYRPSKWEFERAERSGDIEKLLTPDYRCPITTSDKCKFSKYMDYRLIFVLGNKIEVRKCIPSVDPKIEVIFK